jgi:hypothetical protein
MGQCGTEYSSDTVNIHGKETAIVVTPKTRVWGQPPARYQTRLAFFPAATTAPEPPVGDAGWSVEGLVVQKH